MWRGKRFSLSTQRRRVTNTTLTAMVTHYPELSSVAFSMSRNGFRATTSDTGIKRAKPSELRSVRAFGLAHSFRFLK